MANRNDDFDPTVTNVTPVTAPTTAYADAVGGVAAQAAQMSAAGKALAATAATQVQFRQLDGQYRLQNADNPTDPAAMASLQSARQKIVDNQGSNVPDIAMKDFTNKAIELGTQSDSLNTAWATKQQIRNGVNSLQTGRVTYLNEANQAGQAFAADPDSDISTALNYKQSLAAMHQFADPVLGADKTGAFLKDFNTDYVKSFVAGVAQTSPQRAAQLLQDPNVAQHFTTQDIGDMADVIQKTTKQQQLIQMLQNTKGNGNVSDIINDQSKSYFEQRSAIDQMEMSGSITKTVADNARRVIKDANDIDTQTDSPTMAALVTQAYGLNVGKMKPSDYLKGVQSLQETIIEKQAAGQLTGSDAQRVQREISNLTQKKAADATQEVGRGFGAANQMFNTLPPEYRAAATLSLFNASYGQNMTQQQLGNQASHIIDQTNQKRRSDALSIVSATANDTTFLKTAGYTDADVAETAKANNMTPQQVIQTLRNKFNKSPKRGSLSINPIPEDTSNGIRINSNPPSLDGEGDIGQ